MTNQKRSDVLSAQYRGMSDALQREGKLSRETRFCLRLWEGGVCLHEVFGVLDSQVQEMVKKFEKLGEVTVEPMNPLRPASFESVRQGTNLERQAFIDALRQRKTVFDAW